MAEILNDSSIIARTSLEIDRGQGSSPTSTSPGLHDRGPTPIPLEPASPRRNSVSATPEKSRNRSRSDQLSMGALSLPTVVPAKAGPKFVLLQKVPSTAVPPLSIGPRA